MMRSGRLLGSACCVLWALGMLSSAGPVLAQAQCESSAFNTGNATVNSQLFEHSFDSGARWSLCVSSDDRSGLSLEQVYYGAPQDEARKVLESASLAQILFKYDEDINAQHWLSEIGLGGINQLSVDQLRCADGEIIGAVGNPAFCVRHRDLNNLTSLRRTPSLRRRGFSLHAWSQLDGFVVEQVWEFTEDGQITPLVRLGGVLSRFSNNERYSTDIDQILRASHASFVSTWKLDFNINDTPTNDIVEEYSFEPLQSNVLRRAIRVNALSTESFHKVERDRFKGWLIRDANFSSGPNQDTHIGYYIDPQISGFSYTSRIDNWSVFDMAISKQSDCERLASGNLMHFPDCGNSLDDFVNGESVENGDVVVWFSIARQFLPKREDFPALLVREAKFTMMPFDWNASTPFSVIEE